MAITSPYELLDLADGEHVSFRILSWEQASIVIRPAHAPDGKEVSTIRVHVPPADKPTFPPYYDLTSARLVAQLRPQLQRPDLPSLRFTITARGIGAKKSFTLDVSRA